MKTILVLLFLLSMNVFAGVGEKGGGSAGNGGGGMWFCPSETGSYEPIVEGDEYSQMSDLDKKFAGCIVATNSGDIE